MNIITSKTDLNKSFEKLKRKLNHVEGMQKKDSHHLAWAAGYLGSAIREHLAECENDIPISLFSQIEKEIEQETSMVGIDSEGRFGASC